MVVMGSKSYWRLVYLGFFFIVSELIFSTNFHFPNPFSLIDVQIFVSLIFFIGHKFRSCFKYVVFDVIVFRGVNRAVVTIASVVGCWISVTCFKEEVLILNFELGYNLVVIVCSKLYCYFSKTMTWHLIIGYIRWQKNMAFTPWPDPIYTQFEIVCLNK